MFNLDRGLFHLREFPLVTDALSSKRLFERMPSNPLTILNVSIMLLLHIYDLAYRPLAGYGLPPPPPQGEFCRPYFS